MSVRNVKQTVAENRDSVPASVYIMYDCLYSECKTSGWE